LCGEILQLGDFFSKNKKLHEKFVTLGIFSPFFKIIKSATPRPRHFFGLDLQQHFWKNVTTHLGQSSFNANQCSRSSPVNLIEEFEKKNPVRYIAFKEYSFTSAKYKCTLGPNPFFGA